MLATPTSGRLHPNETIVLTADVGATIRYTLDGTPPTNTSTEYTAPITLAEGTHALKAQAFKANSMPSEVLTASCTVTSDWTSRRLPHRCRPSRTRPGGTSDVTVTFTCTDADSAIASCTTMRMVTQEPAGTVVVGTAVDAAGNEATTVIVVNVDRRSPGLIRFAPRDGEIFAPGTTAVTVRGSAADHGSGLVSVTCGTVTATVTGQQYTCSVPVSDGTTTVVVEARDLAGHVASRSVTIEVGEAPAPTSLTISPTTLTMLAGETPVLRVTDHRGARVLTAEVAITAFALLEGSGGSTSGKLQFVGRSRNF